MEFNIKEENGVLTGILNGRLDTAAAVQFMKDFKPMLDNADKTLALDCAGLEYISSSGLRAFLTLRKEVSAKGGKISIRHINSSVANVFRMTGFYNLFAIVD